MAWKRIPQNYIDMATLIGTSTAVFALRGSDMNFIYWAMIVISFILLVMGCYTGLYEYNN